MTSSFYLVPSQLLLLHMGWLGSNLPPGEGNQLKLRRFNDVGHALGRCPYGDIGADNIFWI